MREIKSTELLRKDITVNSRGKLSPNKLQRRPKYRQ